jgi:hypothetical protein
MFRRITVAAALALGLSGCITVYEYGGDVGQDDGYYSEPSIDRYQYGDRVYGPFYDRYYDPYYDFGYRRYSGWSGSIGYRFGDGAYGRYGFPYWYFGYGYGYGFPHDPFWPHRYYGHRNPYHRPPTHRPPQHPPSRVHHRPPQYPAQIQRLPAQAAEREDQPWRRRQGLGRPVPEIITAPRSLTGAMPRPVPRRPDSTPVPVLSQSQAVVARPSPSYRIAEPRQDAPPGPAPMPARRFEQPQDASAFRPSPAPRHRPEAQEREPRPEPK